MIKVDIYHNVAWSKYKARVFSEIFNLDVVRNNLLEFNVVQIAESESYRAGMGDSWVDYHKYKYTILHRASYDAIPVWKLCFGLFWRVLISSSQIVLLPGYYRLEHWFMLLACVLSGKKRVVFSDSTLRDKKVVFFIGVLKRIFLLLCHGVFTYGQRGKEHLLYFGVPENKILFRCQAAALPDGYDPGAIKSQRICMATPVTSPRFLFVGRLSKDKSLDVLIDAFSKFYSKNKDAKLVLVGSGPQREELLRRAAEYNLGPSVEFLGGLEPEAVAAEYLKATCMILPSRKEPWGLVVNEALHYGCPVIVSDNCGCVPELVLDGKSSIVFETDNVNDLFDKMNIALLRFYDFGLVADDALSKIQCFIPKKSASQIVSGVRGILNR